VWQCAHGPQLVTQPCRFSEQGQRRSWRSTQCIEIHGVSSGLVETRLNALIAFLKPGMLWLPKISKESFPNHSPNAR
jgi:hypothetical protein